MTTYPVGGWAGAPAVPDATTTIGGGIPLGHSVRAPEAMSAVERLASRPRPKTAQALQRACARWVVAMFAMAILLQRFAVPTQPVSLLLPLALIGCGYGMFRGVLEFDRDRIGWWLAAAGLSGLVVPLQYLFVHRPVVSVTSWGLLLATWVPFIFRLKDRRRSTYVLALRGIVRTGLVLAGTCTGMMVAQLAGLPYTDYLGNLLPESFLLQGFVVSYPIVFGSPVYRANAWIGLEPSMISFQIGVVVVAAILLRVKLPKLLLLLVGMLCTTAASGFTVVAVGVLTILFSRMRWVLFRYVLLIPAAMIVVISTPFGQQLLERAGTGTSDESTSARAITPYSVIWPNYAGDPVGVLLGHGPGSSQQLADVYNLTVAKYAALLIPAPIKLFYDYGLIAGIGLAVFLILVYLGGPSRALALAVGVNLWTVQPGTTTMVFVILIPLLITLWVPRLHRPLEDDLVPSPNAVLALHPVPPGQRKRR